MSPDSHVSRAKALTRFCNVCGKPSDKRICDSCAMKIQLEAISRKTHEENGDAWTRWEPHDAAHKQR